MPLNSVSPVMLEDVVIELDEVVIPFDARFDGLSVRRPATLC